MRALAPTGILFAALVLLATPAAAQRPSSDNDDGALADDKVKPGLVQWHESLEAACAASRESHRPVLLFQMVGRLDDRFT